MIRVAFTDDEAEDAARALCLIAGQCESDARNPNLTASRLISLDSAQRYRALASKIDNTPESQ